MDQYSTLEKVGHGSYGEVWLVRHKTDKKRYVLKQIGLQNASHRERRAAQLEAKLLATLKHPNIVSYRDSFVADDNFLYIAMGYCEGGDLYTSIKERNGVPFHETQIAEWVIQICMALQYLHERNVLHRDLKTQNIFLTKSRLIKVGDLGIAKVLDSDSDMATTLIGTPYYMSPELFSNRPYNHKSDVWALGCCVYEIATLRHAFNARDINSLMYKILRGKLPAMPKRYSRDLIDLICAMLHHDPDKRPSVSRILRTPYMKKNIAAFLEGTRHFKRPVSERNQNGDVIECDGTHNNSNHLSRGNFHNGSQGIKNNVDVAFHVEGRSLCSRLETDSSTEPRENAHKHVQEVTASSNGPEVFQGNLVKVQSSVVHNNGQDDDFSSCHMPACPVRKHSPRHRSLIRMEKVESVSDDQGLVVSGHEVKLEERMPLKRLSVVPPISQKSQPHQGNVLKMVADKDSCAGHFQPDLQNPCPAIVLPCITERSDQRPDVKDCCCKEQKITLPNISNEFVPVLSGDCVSSLDGAVRDQSARVRRRCRSNIFDNPIPVEKPRPLPQLPSLASHGHRLPDVQRHQRNHCEFQLGPLPAGGRRNDDARQRRRERLHQEKVRATPEPQKSTPWSSEGESELGSDLRCSSRRESPDGSDGDTCEVRREGEINQLLCLLNSTLKVDPESPPNTSPVNGVTTSLTSESEPDCRLQHRMKSLRKDCLDGLGVQLLGEALKLLDNLDSHSLETNLKALLGGRFETFVGKIWQLKYCEDSLDSAVKLATSVDS